MSLPSQRVVRVLERIVAWRDYPNQLRMDNGPEFISATLAEWSEEHYIKLEFKKPGTSTQNSYIERFNLAYRDEILNEVRELAENWIREYIEERPHD